MQPKLEEKQELPKRTRHLSDFYSYLLELNVEATGLLASRPLVLGRSEPNIQTEPPDIDLFKPDKEVAHPRKRIGHDSGVSSKQFLVYLKDRKLTLHNEAINSLCFYWRPERQDITPSRKYELETDHKISIGNIWIILKFVPASKLPKGKFFQLTLQDYRSNMPSMSERETPAPTQRDSQLADTKPIRDHERLPMLELIENVADNTDALLALDDYTGLLVRLSGFYAPKRDYELTTGYTKNEVQHMLEETIASFPGDRNQKQTLKDELNWLKGLLKNGEYEQADDYLTEATAAISHLVSDGRDLGKEVENFFKSINKQSKHSTGF